MKNLIVLTCLILAMHQLSAQELSPFDLSAEWSSKIQEIAPPKPVAKPKSERKVLIFDLHTGYQHWVIPHTTEMVKILGETSGAYSAVVSKDISVFEKDELAQYDAIVLNNNCSDRAKRNLFWDQLGKTTNLTDKERLNEAQRLEQNLLDYVSSGGGLVVLHGGITMLNNSAEFSKMLGGSFDYHPPQQEVIANVVDKEHPITAPFDGASFVGIDEPYFLNNAYFDYNFKPLLSMNTGLLEDKRESVSDTTKYIAWIKRHGEGRVFYSAPSHNAQNFENPNLLAFFLNGLQYALGDLECDDSPLEK